MSDPVTNVEIEDVLSSIRRLVSDEGRTARDAFDEQPDTVEPEGDKASEDAAFEPERPAPALILTPALRVADAEETSDTIDAEVNQEVSTEVNSEEKEPDDVPSQDAHSEEGNQAVGDPLVLEWEDVAPEPLDSEGEADLAESHDVALSDESGNSQVDADTVEDQYAFEGEPEPIEIEPGAEEGLGTDEDLHEQDDIVDEETQDEFETVTAEADLPPQAMMEDAGQGRSIEDKIAALEALIGRSDGEFEPDGAEANAATKARSGGPLPWPEEAKQSVVPDPATESQSTDFDAEAIAFQAAHAAATHEAEEGLIEAAAHTLPEGLGEDAAALIDEEALRDMVADIVRQELQGPLGERITRNVRKLVRREIYRAMAANELD